jgi:uncharacterized protein (DUF2141 family)
MALLMSVSLSGIAQATPTARSVLAQGAPDPTAAAATGTITVEVERLRNSEGQVLFALFRSKTGFPKEPRRAAQRVASPIREGRARAVFENVPPGELAISVLHDEDGDFKVKTGLFGIPREGIGFSRNARATFGPPSFDDAKLSLVARANEKIIIEIQYY